MTQTNQNILMTAVLFQATTHLTAVLKGDVHGGMGNALDKWFKVGVPAIKKMNRMLGPAEESIEMLTIITVDVLQSLINMPDPEDFVKYLNNYKK